MAFIGGILFLLLGLAQLGVGAIGVEHFFGEVWMYVAIFAAILFRITLPITIASFFGATEVLGWHWLVALLFAAPGLVIATPALLSSFIRDLRER